MGFISGPYTWTYNGSNIGVVQDAPRMRFVHGTEIVTGDNLGETIQAVLERGGNLFWDMVFQEFNLTAAQQAFWPFGSAFGRYQTNRIGCPRAPRVLAGTAISQCADPQQISMSAILAPDFPLEMLFGSRLRNVPVSFLVFPSIDSSTGDMVFFQTAGTTAQAIATGPLMVKPADRILSGTEAVSLSGSQLTIDGAVFNIESSDWDGTTLRISRPNNLADIVLAADNIGTEAGQVTSADIATAVQPGAVSVGSIEVPPAPNVSLATEVYRLAASAPAATIATAGSSGTRVVGRTVTISGPIRSIAARWMRDTDHDDDDGADEAVCIIKYDGGADTEYRAGSGDVYGEVFWSLNAQTGYDLAGPFELTISGTQAEIEIVVTRES